MADNKVREWEEGLPSPAELAPLSQCLISPELASAFSITSELPPFHTLADVNRASQSTFAILRAAPSISLSSLGGEKIRPAADARGVLQREDVNGKGASGDNNQIVSKHFQPQSGLRGAASASTDMHRGATSASTDMLGSYKHDGKGAFSAAKPIGLPSYPTNDRKSVGSAVPAASMAVSESSYGTARTARVEADPEEAESGPAPEESNDDQSTQTLKRPRLVWTPELHKRFVEAVAHLGIKNAVPKTIMQLMNVEGLTRENVASHLQKYRLYLKRMQGLSNEGPSASDQLFASTPVPPSLAASARFFPGMHGQMDEYAPLPYPIPHAAVSFGRPHIPGTVHAGPFGAMDPHTYNALARPPPQRFVPRDQREMLAKTQSSSPHHIQPSSPHHILRLFPASSR